VVAGNVDSREFLYTLSNVNSLRLL
jgi:hypothetical protein